MGMIHVPSDLEMVDIVDTFVQCSNVTMYMYTMYGNLAYDCRCSNSYCLLLSKKTHKTQKKILKQKK